MIQATELHYNLVALPANITLGWKW